MSLYKFVLPITSSMILVGCIHFLPAYPENIGWKTQVMNPACVRRAVESVSLVKFKDHVPTKTVEDSNRSNGWVTEYEILGLPHGPEASVTLFEMESSKEVRLMNQLSDKSLYDDGDEETRQKLFNGVKAVSDRIVELCPDAPKPTYIKTNFDYGLFKKK